MLSGFVFCLSFIPKEFGRFLFFSSLFVHNFFGLAEKKKMFSTLKKKRSGRRKKTPNINQEDFDADLYSSSHGDRHRRRIKKNFNSIVTRPYPKGDSNATASLPFYETNKYTIHVYNNIYLGIQY